MLVPGPDLIAARFIPAAEGAPLASRVFVRDPRWTLPRGWRAGFRDGLAGYVRAGHLPFEDAVTLEKSIVEVVARRELDTNARGVLRLVLTTGRPACDCEFAWLAAYLTTPLVTADPALLDAFPDHALHPDDFLARPRE